MPNSNSVSNEIAVGDCLWKQERRIFIIDGENSGIIARVGDVSLC